MADTDKLLVLGSSSRYRKALLERLNLPFECVSPEIDETPLSEEAPLQLVQRLAKQKAQAIAKQRPDAVVIGSDQVCVNGARILGKPHTVEAACDQLAAASGKAVQFLTSLCVLDSDGTAHESVSIIDVQFRELSAVEIARYVEADQPLDCAGSFKSEALGVTLFESVKSDDLTALEGLPLIKTAAFLRHCGFQLP
ncbi:MAG: Maf family protein [Gammaproteobacteria bacterium]|nr:Maf family protein [Gammaproteobacteria bacterium]